MIIIMKNMRLLMRAKKFCVQERHRFTKPREHVLTMLAHAKNPIGAYQISNTPAATGEKFNPATVYRAIKFWLKHEFIHCIESMNTYIACCKKEHHTDFCVFICEKCNQSIELSADFILQTTPEIQQPGLQISKTNIEIRGSCNNCILLTQPVSG